MQEITHADWTIGLPDKWIDNSIVIFNGPPNDGFSPNITVLREPMTHPLSAEEYASNQLAGLMEEFNDQNYQVLEEGTVKLGELAAYYRIHSFLMDDNRSELTQMQVYVVRGLEAITITFTHLSQWFPLQRQVFLDSLSMFSWGSRPRPVAKSVVKKP
ncbi:MAG: DcrB-related protein [Candidatus Caldarchaeum sp.]